jgi:branched-chain amino acid transport system permease protein
MFARPISAWETPVPRLRAEALPLALLLALPAFVPDAWLVRLTLLCCYAIGVLGQTLLIGFAGQISLGQAGFLALGAYSFAHLRQAGLPFLLALLAAGVVAGAAGVAVGVPSLRLRGPYLAIATLGFGLAVYQALAASEALSGGRSGLRVPPLDLPTGVPASLGLYYVALVLLIGSAAAAGNLVSSYVGRAWLALRDAEPAAAAAGVNPSRYRLLAFSVSSFYAGVHGALLAQFLGHLEPQGFTLGESITMLAAVVVGGASVIGALLGAAFVTLLPALAGERGFVVPVSLGLAMILVVRFEPEGLAGLVQALSRRLEASRSR